MNFRPVQYVILTADYINTAVFCMPDYTNTAVFCMPDLDTCMALTKHHRRPRSSVPASSAHQCPPSLAPQGPGRPTNSDTH
eukprot:COSAG06_NODE_19179_length_850_cov_1.087883_2_plen_80_part_01